MKRIWILGCGNRLFGDDGFGPEAVEYFIGSHPIPEDVEVCDAGTGVRNLLFNLVLGEEKPEKVVIVDAVDVGRKPGELFDLELEQIPLKKRDDFSMHSLPTSNLLHELSEGCRVTVKILAAQVEHIPDHVSPGLSPTLRKALPGMCLLLEEEIRSSG